MTFRPIHGGMPAVSRTQGRRGVDIDVRILVLSSVLCVTCPECRGSPEGGLQMAHRYGPESLEDEVADLREKQKQLLSALQLLFDLLEEYAPSWYTEEHHTKALAALRLQP